MLNLKNAKLKTKMSLLIGSAMVGLLVFGAMAHSTINQVRVGSPLANELRTHIELGGDLTPATLDISLGRLVVYRMLVETDPKKLQAEAGELHTFSQAYANAHARWVKDLPEGKLKELVVTKMDEPAVKYLQMAEQDLVPALLAGDKKKAESIRNAMRPFFDANQDAAGEADKLRAATVEQVSQRADRTVRSSLLILFACGALVSGIVCVLGLLIARSILGPLGKTMRVLIVLAEGDLRQQVEVDSGWATRSIRPSKAWRRLSGPLPGQPRKWPAPASNFPARAS